MPGITSRPRKSVSALNMAALVNTVALLNGRNKNHMTVILPYNVLVCTGCRKILASVFSVSSYFLFDVVYYSLTSVMKTLPLPTELLRIACRKAPAIPLFDTE